MFKIKELSLIAKSAGITILGFMASKVFAYIYSILLARTLGAAELGVFMLATGVLGFVIMFANLGLPYGIMRYVAFYKSQRKEENVKGTIIGGIIVNLASSAIFGLALFLSADFIGTTIYNQPSLSDVLKLFSLIVPLGTISTSLLLSIQGLKQIKYKVYVRNFIEISSKTLFYFMLFIMGFRLMGAAFSLLLSYTISLIASLYFLEKKVYPFLKTTVKPKYNFKELLNFSWPLLVATFFSMLLTSIDSFMLGYFIDTASVGIYSVASTIAKLQLIAYNSMGLLFLPIIAGYFALQKTSEMKQFFTTVTRWIFSLSFPLLLFFALFSHQIIEVFYGKEYITGSVALTILAIGFFTIAAGGLAQDALKAIGKPRFELLNTSIAAISNIALNLALIPGPPHGLGLGIIGAAIATAVSYILWNALSILELYTIVKAHPYNTAYLKPVAAGLISITPIYMAKQITPKIEATPFPANVFMLACFGAGFIGLYLLLFILLRGPQSEDITILAKIEAKTGIRVPGLRNFIKRFS